MPKKARKQSTYVDFRTVKAAVSFEAVLEYYNLLEDLDPKDDGYTGDCPFHEGESRRPFHVSLTKNAWYCFGCEEGGNVLDFVARMEDVSIKQAAELLAEWFEIEDARRSAKTARGKRRANKRRASIAERQEVPQEASDELEEEAPMQEESEPEDERGNKPLGFSLKNLDAGHELLEPVGFDRTTLERFEAGYCAKGMMKGRLAIPIHSPTGDLLAYAGKSLGEEDDYKYPPKFDRHLELYNLHRAIEFARGEGLIVVADILDVWRLAVEGFENAVALMAHEMTPRQEALVSSFAGDREQVYLLLPPGNGRDAILADLISQVWVRAMELDEFLA